MRIRFVRQAALTTTGTLDFTVSGAGTCIGAIFWVTRASADATQTNSAALNIGAYDGTRQWAMGVTSAHNVATTNTTRRGMTDQAVLMLTVAGAINGEASGNGFITDGVQVNFTTGFGAASIITAALFFSDNANDHFYAGTLDNTGGDADVTAPAFRPSAVMLASIAQALDDAAGDEAHFCYGWAIDGVVTPPNQFGMTFFEADGQAAGRPATYIIHPTTKHAIQSLTDYSTLGGGVQVDDFDANGFTAVQVGGAGLVCGYVAIACDNDVALTLFTTPTSAGATSYTGVGFYPQAVLGFETLGDALDSIVDSGEGGSVGLFGFTGPSEEFSEGIQCEYNSATTDTQCYIDDVVIALRDDDGGLIDDILGEVTALLSNGFEVTYSAVAPTTRFFGGFSIKPMSQTISPNGMASLEAWGTPTLNLSAQTLSPGAIASLEAWGSPTLNATVNVSPAGIASLEAWGTPTLNLSAQTLSPTAIASLEAWGSPTLNAAVNVSPGSIASLETWGSPTLTTAVNVSPSAIASAEAWGVPSLAAVISISPSAIASLEAWGAPTLVAGGLVLSPSAIASLEAWGTPSLSPGAVSILVAAIASAEAWGTPDLLSGLSILPTGIASLEAWGTPSLAPGAVSILVAAIASAEAWGSPALAEGVGEQTITVGGIASAETWGTPYLFGGAVPLTLKKKIHDALCAAAEGGTFVVATYDSENCTLEQGLQVVPASVEANELSSAYAVEQRHGRKYLQDFTDWQWLVILRFQQEVICEPWVRALLEDPICIQRDAFEERQVRLLLLDAKYEHPPREGSSNGTKAEFRFRAELSAR